jgi:hypothetical protein
MNDNSQITQIIIKKFADFINKQGFSDEKKQEIVIQFSNTIATQFMLSVSRTFTDQDMQKWKTYKNTNPSDIEQWETMETFYKQKTNEDFGDLLNRLTTNLIANTVSMTKEQTELIQRISRLSETDKALFDKYVDEENLTEANKILYGGK